MDALLDRHVIDPAGLAGLLRGVAPADERAQARSYLAHKRAGAHLDDPLVRELIRTGRTPARGSAIGGGTMGIPFRNHPASDPYVIDTEVFEDATIKNVWKSAMQDYRGYNTQQSGFDLPKRGLLAEIELIFAGTYTNTVGTGSHTVTDYFADGLLEKIELSVNGHSIKSAESLAFEYRRQVVTRKGTAVPDSVPIAAGANVWDKRFRIPVADNLRNLWGAIYTPGDDMYPRLDLSNAAQAKIVALTGDATATLTGTYQLLYTAYDAPWVEIPGVGLRIVLPDTDVLHRMHQYSQAVPAGSGANIRMELQRTAGEVERLYLFLENGPYALTDPASWTEVRFSYLETEQPIKFLAGSLLADNARDYSNKITPKCVVIDFSAKNQRRDGLFPKNVIEPAVEIDIPATITINANARLHVVQEMLVGGA